MTKILLVLAITYLPMYGWSQDSLLSRLTSFPDKVKIKTASLDQQLTRKTEQYLHRLLKIEKKLKKKLGRFDSSAAATLFSAGTNERYSTALNKLKSITAADPVSNSGQYLPFVDSLQGSLSFLKEHAASLPGANLLNADLQKPLDQLKQLQGKLQQAEYVKQLIQQRKEQVKRYLSKYAKLPAGLKKLYGDYSKQAYYYSQQLKEYKEALNDPGKMFTLALKVLNKLPAFTEFMRKNSMLAGLLNFPGGSPVNSTALVTGLQTRDQLMAYIQNQSNGNPNAFANMQQSINAAQQQTDDLRSRLNLRGLNSEELDMPDFKPNGQKTKSFWRRLEYGTNLQTVQGKYYFPITSDLAFSLGYKLNDKNVIGIGASYKVGWGKDIKNIDITSQGAGIRSFIDINLKKSFYLSGGFEYNYQPVSARDSLSIYRSNGEHWNAWQQSGLIGVTKIVSLKTKVFKKAKVQLLWDFLNPRQAPGTPALKFRVGYSF